jgi:hypothetical protein
MITEAQRTQASDIHIESNPGEALTAIRFRRDGDLEPYLWLPSKLRAPLVSRIKIMAKLDIAERRRPQDGKIDFSEFGGKNLELRVAVMPTHDGLEDVVLRLLTSAKPLPLGKLGLQPRDLATIAGFSQRLRHGAGRGPDRFGQDDHAAFHAGRGEHRRAQDLDRRRPDRDHPAGAAPGPDEPQDRPDLCQRHARLSCVPTRTSS